MKFLKELFEQLRLVTGDKKAYACTKTRRNTHMLLAPDVWNSVTLQKSHNWSFTPTPCQNHKTAERPQMEIHPATLWNS